MNSNAASPQLQLSHQNQRGKCQMKAHEILHKFMHPVSVFLHIALHANVDDESSERSNTQVPSYTAL